MSDAVLSIKSAFIHILRRRRATQSTVITLMNQSTTAAQQGFDRNQLFLKGTFFLGLWDSEQLVICMLNM